MSLPFTFFSTFLFYKIKLIEVPQHYDKMLMKKPCFCRRHVDFLLRLA